jgi:hypothetical protein
VDDALAIDPLDAWRARDDAFVVRSLRSDRAVRVTFRNACVRARRDDATTTRDDATDATTTRRRRRRETTRDDATDARRRAR